MTIQRCSRCQVERDVTQFGWDKCYKRPRKICKPCEAARTKRRYESMRLTPPPVNRELKRAPSPRECGPVCSFFPECTRIVRLKLTSSPYCFPDSPYYHRYVAAYEAGTLAVHIEKVKVDSKGVENAVSS